MKPRDRLIVALFLIAALSVPLLSASPSEIYRWKDKDGKIVFSDTPPPPGVDVQIKNYKDEPVENPQGKGGNSNPQGRGVIEKRQRGVSVILYMTSWCPYCKKAREYLKSLNVSLVEYDVEKDKSRGDEMVRKSGGSRGVPVIDVEGTIIQGFDPEAIRSAVERRRNL